MATRALKGGRVQLYGDWMEFQGTFRNFQRRLEAEVGKATRQNAMLVAREMKATIKAKVPPENAWLTRMIKRRNKPLVDRGDLWKAVTGEKVRWNLGYAGLLRTSKRVTAGKHRMDTLNLGWRLHEGGTIKVTRRMANMFRWLWLAANDRVDPSQLTGRAAALWDRRPSKQWPLIPEGAIMRIPGRPFVERTLKNQWLGVACFANWKMAVEKALLPRRKKGVAPVSGATP